MSFACRNNLIVFVLILACPLFVCRGIVAAAPPHPAVKPQLDIAWNILTGNNRPATHATPFVSELILTNNGDETLGPQGWQIYFNFCRKILPDEPVNGVRVIHVNGDLFRLEPSPSFAPFRPGEILTVRLRTEAPLIKASDAPSGFFLVMKPDGQQHEVVESLGDAKVGTIDGTRQTMRTPDDQVEAPTARSRYESNLSLSSADDPSANRIIPTPISIKRAPGKTTIDRNTVIVAESQLKAEAAYLADALEPLLGFRILIHDPEESTSNAIVLSSQKITVDGVPKTSGDNAYRLKCAANSVVTIAGTDAAGILYGIQSLRALLPVSAYEQVAESISFPAVEIEDAPRFTYRGLHLDVARNFQKPATVKKLLELMAFYKLNKFHFHLTDDEGWRLEIKGLPELTEVGGRRGYAPDGQTLPPSFGSGPVAEAPNSHGSGYYSREEFIDILRFAAERHIEVIPEIDLPGHARAAIRAMDVRRDRLLAKGLEKAANEFLLHDPADNSHYESVQLWNDNVVNVCQQSTYAFIKLVLSEIRDLYSAAGLTLKTVHLGGDEVPEGVWEDSPRCRETFQPHLAGQTSLKKEAMARFFNQISGFLLHDKIVAGAWEEIFLEDLRKSQLSGGASPTVFLGPGFLCYAWNNVWGWGQEDAAYRLANAGVDVVLCNATHLYFDLAYSKDPLEPGYYWAGFIETKAPFSFAPLSYLKKTRKDIYGHEISRASIEHREHLTEQGRKHIQGIQGQLWGENLKGQDRLAYMALPRVIALAERAWAAEPEWARDENLETWPQKLQRSWSQFATQVGTEELPRLDYLEGGFNYHIPAAGAVIEDGILKANVAYPGLALRYTTDGTEPDANSPLYSEPTRVGTSARVRVFTSTGRGGRSCTVREKVSRVN